MKKSLSLMITSFLVLVFAFVLASCPGPETANKITYEDFDAAIKYIKNKGVVATSIPTSNGDLDISLIQDNQGNNGDNDMLFETFFSFNKIENNLIYLNINFNSLTRVDTGLFEKINNFKSLRYLYIKYFEFNKILNLKLKI